jgi:hypothetical protein
MKAAWQMRQRLRARRRSARRFKSPGIAFVILCVLLAAGLDWLSSALVVAQTSSAQQSRAISPLFMRSTGPAEIPLGVTEVATPSISPISPSVGAGMETCAGSNAAALSGAPFDGGGLSGNASLSCADSRLPLSLLPSSSAGRVGIPLGATEIDSAGVSPVAPVAGANLSTNAASANGPGKP